jgi:hypothetical protein
MKRDGLLKPVLVASVAALALYIVTYNSIEHRRTRNGPWQVTFGVDGGAPALWINQPALAITNLQITFPGEAVELDHAGTFLYREPQPVPYSVPFGKCLFMDTTFLPGTIAFSLFGHEIQLIPRVLTIDGKELPWRSNTKIPVTSTNLASGR